MTGQITTSIEYSKRDSQIERLQDKIYMGKATRADITRVTKRLGDEIGRVYGWDFPKSRTTVEREVG